MSSHKTKQLIILDRDGVINVDKDDYVKNADEWQPIPGSLEAISKLSNAGYLVGVATNQSGVGRKYFSLDDLHAMHDKMLTLLHKVGGEIHSIAYCPHLPDAGCDCRKPQPGLVHQIEQDLDISASGSYFIGDKQSDLDAALNAGCKPILVRTGQGIKTEQALRGDKRYPLVFDNLAAVTEFLLQ